MNQKEPMTLEGYDLLVEEFKFLIGVEKPKTAEEKLVAAAQGDRSENADYHAAKEKLRFIDRRLFYLNSMIEKSHIVDPSSFEHKKVSFGSTVTLLHVESDEEEVYTICGTLESEPEHGLITIHSPLARSMIGKEVDDDFKVQLPKGNKEYEILEIEYKNIFSLKQNIRTKKDFSFH